MGAQLGQVLPVHVHEAEIVLLEAAMRSAGAISWREAAQALGFQDAVDRVAIEMRQKGGDHKGEVIQRKACRTTRPYTPRTNGMVERFNGRIQREVLGITIASHGDLEILLRGFDQAYNARRQRVLKGQSPERVVSERLGALPARANPSHDPPFDPCILPKALQVITRAKDVSHPDT